MEAEPLMLVVLSELMDSDNEKFTHEKTHSKKIYLLKNHVLSYSIILFCGSLHWLETEKLICVTP